MGTKVGILFIGSLYELIRFIFLVILTLGIINPGYDSFTLLFIVLVAAPGLIMSAGSLLAGLYPRKYGVYTKLLALGKLVGLLPVIVILLNAAGVLTTGVSNVRLGGLVFLFAGAAVLDLLFFFFLVSFNTRKASPGGTENPGHQIPADDLPDWHATRIEE